MLLILLWTFSQANHGRTDGQEDSQGDYTALIESVFRSVDFSAGRAIFICEDFEGV